MSDFINSYDEQIASKRGMLFLFDVANSSERASKSEDIANSIFYQKISIIVKNEEHFKYWLGALPFYDNVVKEGVVIDG